MLYKFLAAKAQLNTCTCPLSVCLSVCPSQTWISLFLHHFTALFTTVHHCALLYNTVQHCTTLYNTVQHCTTLYTTVQHCTPLFNTVHHCTILNPTGHHSTSLYTTVILHLFQIWIYLKMKIKSWKEKTLSEIMTT